MHQPQSQCQLLAVCYGFKVRECGKNVPEIRFLYLIYFTVILKCKETYFSAEN